ncbi:MAG: hypothetical protein A2Z34_09230 [Planctomycetes bacterium RBG_16_59_8]|nr:MAG: hypothetical protein A2Z34_09230 [Planctomycetes bacterium RBG_16_59_8]
MPDICLALIALLLPLAPQAVYEDKITKKGTDEPISCRILNETCREIEYMVKLGSSPVPQKQTLPTGDVERVEYGTNRVSSNYNQAMRLMGEENYKDAITLLERAVSDWLKDKDPSQPQYAYYHKAVCLERIGKLEDAEKAYADLFKNCPDTKFFQEIYYNKFNNALRKGDHAAASAIISKFQSEAASKRLGNKLQGEIDMLNATLLETKKQWPAAMAIYARYENDANPAVAEMATLGLLNAMRQSGKSGDLRSKSNSLVKGSTSSPRVLTAAYNALGDYELSIGKNREAMLCFLRGVVLYQPKRTPEYEYALYGAAVAMARFATEQPPENKEVKARYKGRALENVSMLVGMYGASRYAKEAQAECDKIK